MKSLLVYKASAGSGKTFTLAVEYIKLLIANPYAYRNILAVTFTNKATAEMKVRILGQLNGIAKGLRSSIQYFEKIKEAPEIQALNLSDAQIRSRAQKALSAMLHDYTRFRITTIDSFFQSIVRELAYELDLTANLRVDLNAKEALEETVKSIVEDLNNHYSEDDRVRKENIMQLLTSFMFERIDEDKAWNVMKEVKSFGENIFTEQYLKQGAQVRSMIGDPTFLTQVKAHLHALMGKAEGDVKRLGADFWTLLSGYEDKLYNGSRGVKGILTRILNFTSKMTFADVMGTGKTDYTLSLDSWSKDMTVQSEFARKNILQRYADLLEGVKAQCMRIVTARVMLTHINEMMLLNTINETLRQKNKEANRFILADTAHFLRDMVGDSDIPFIYERTGARYQHIMIDEFQDTSELQWGNFLPLLKNSLDARNKCLIVGDVKQSIYRWRNSDWRTLNNIDSESELSRYVVQPTMDVNYRSSEMVVEFNNAFFNRAVKFVASSYCATIDDPTGSMATPILTAYAQVHQQVPDKHKGYGYVSIDNLCYPASKRKAKVEGDATEAAPQKSRDEIMLDRFGERMREVLEGGVKPKDIAILVRKNDEGIMIADYMEREFPHVKVVSNEAFLLNTSVAVNLLVLALRVVAHPEDVVAMYSLAMMYHREVVCRKVEHADENSAFLTPKEQVMQLLPCAFNEERARLQEMPVYELCEQLYAWFELETIKGQDAYLYCFFDQMLAYLQDHEGTIDALLNYWDEKLYQQAVPIGDAEGVQILTVHKSKGLEFHTVIAPFFEWNVDGYSQGSMPSMIWCQPSEPVFSDILKLVPVQYNKTLNETYFQKDFQEELLRKLVDNLNVLYVAFTRAENNLIVLTGAAAETTAGKVATTVNDIVIKGIPKEVPEKAEEATENPALEVVKDTTYTFGTLVPSETDEGTEQGEDDDAVEEINYLEPDFEKCNIPFASQPTLVSFRQSNESQRFLNGEDSDAAEIALNYVEEGNFYHNLMERVHTCDDIATAVDAFEREGLIQDAPHKSEVLDFLTRAFSKPEVREWFAPKWRVLNEANILYPLNAEDGKYIERPDRVICDDKETIVVDYKTGRMECLRYMDQVKGYLKLLAAMGYPNPHGYVWYMRSNKVVPVTLG